MPLRGRRDIRELVGGATLPRDQSGPRVHGECKVAAWQHSISGFTVHGSAARLKPIFANLCFRTRSGCMIRVHSNIPGPGSLTGPQEDFGM